MKFGWLCCERPGHRSGARDDRGTDPRAVLAGRGRLHAEVRDARRELLAEVEADLREGGVARDDEAVEQ